jgi:glycosyltransferase involved in cell wall biosynthesis
VGVVNMTMVNKKDKKVVVYTQAYNAEKTLVRAMESILGQTRGDLVYYVCDNGSTDGTREIIRNYAARDNRVILQTRDTNSILADETLPFFTFVSELMRQQSEGYLALLDADDEYAPDFLEKTLAFMEKHNLNIAACGNDFIDADSGALKSRLMLPSDLILTGKGFDEHFIAYYRFMTTIWGKLYDLALLRKCDFADCDQISFGADMLFAMEAFRNAERVGILAESLHKYYVSPQSVGHQLIPKRLISDQTLFDAGRDFLSSKCGGVSRRNGDCLIYIYLGGVRTTQILLMNAQIPAAEKLRGLLSLLRGIFSRVGIGELIRWGVMKVREKIFRRGRYD